MTETLDINAAVKLLGEIGDQHRMARCLSVAAFELNPAKSYEEPLYGVIRTLVERLSDDSRICQLERYLKALAEHQSHVSPSPAIN